MSTNLEWIKNSEGKRIYAISHASAVVRNKSTVDSDLTKLEADNEESKETLQTLKQIVQSNAWIILGKATYGGEITIPAVGWTEENDLYILEIENSQITESTMPLIAISPESYSIALDCGLKPYCRTFEGKLKIYADSPPVSELIASISLVGENTVSGKGLQVNALTGTVSVDPNIVVMNDDVVDEDKMNTDINSWLNS